MPGTCTAGALELWGRSLRGGRKREGHSCEVISQDASTFLHPFYLPFQYIQRFIRSTWHAMVYIDKQRPVVLGGSALVLAKFVYLDSDTADLVARYFRIPLIEISVHL